ncbi:uncharacterized protein M6B38_171420 [Iris pallida]|uniref:Uncharacterized protein n=1 Tax=Iris pallida TaxID=29817 RepID=A0AAX6EV42_IRIPA|nr:uncharacterized protein M6B38_171420 [Iris pallida]
MAIRCCSCRSTLLLLLLVSAVPISIIVSLESTTWTSSPNRHHLRYRSLGLVRECAKWDASGGRFLVSNFFGGGLAEVSDVDVGAPAERTLMREPDVAGNVSLGLVVDGGRGRVLVVFSDLFRHRYAAVGAYRLDNFERIFLTRLSGPEDETSFADDVAVDSDGNAYVTDAKRNKIWKVGSGGALSSVIRSPLLERRKEWYHLVGLNGIVYHPNGYLLVVHTDGGDLFRVDTSTEEVTQVDVEGSILGGDGLELLSPTKIVVAAFRPSARLVESSDDWRTATVTGTYSGPLHRVAAAATAKDGKVYVSHLFGGRSHVISEAVFSPLSSAK